MDEVYRSARIVQVCPGAGAEQTAVAIVFLSDLAPKAEPFGISEKVGEPRYVLGWPSVTVSRSQAEQLLADAVVANVDLLTSRPWFSGFRLFKTSASRKK